MIRPIFLLLFPFLLLAQCLEQGEIEFFSGSKEVTSYCFDKNKYLILKKSCLQDKNCLAISQYNKKWSPLVMGPMGNPFHLNCRQRGGRPEMVRIKTSQNQWQETALCFFSDNSFISVFNHLVQH